MSTAELKVNMFELITQTDDEHTLMKLYRKMREVFEDSDYGLSPEQERELLSAYQDSFVAENVASHEEAMQTHARWLKLNIIF
jgi:hypothetical protein